jgi:UDP-glucose 4-epimerase
MILLITGGLGHIGSYVIPKLINEKNINKIYLLDNLSNQRFNVLFELKDKKVSFIYGDLSNKKTLKNLPKSDIVIHLASITNAEKSFENEKEVNENNFGSFKNIVEYCNKYKSRLIHISSTSVYGPQKNLVNENQKKIFPRSPYAEIKWKEEKILKKQTKFKFITLRFATISGFSNGMRFHTAVNKFCLNSVLKIPIPIWGRSINLFRPYLSLKDATKTIKFIISKKFFPCDVFNILSENKTIDQILKIIKQNNLKPKIMYVKSRILNQDSYKISKKKIEKYGLKLNSKISSDIKQTVKKLKISK